jgi:HD-GYP domain-containing protein (c-di-GMP phosphodiesterase class II)/pSer/pThr/pTyr-binding forkhead associated (FHA) protein
MAFIRVKTGPHKGKAFEIKERPLTIGREESQLIQILDQGVSRAHAEVFRLGEMCFVRDLDSTNGTYVNDVKVSEECLKAGDELLIGTTILRFEDSPPGTIPEGRVEIEGEEGTRIETHTVELKVGSQPAKALGREVQSRNLTLVNQVGKIVREARGAAGLVERTVELLSSAIGASQGYYFGFEPGTGRPVPQVVVEAEDAGPDRKASRTILNRVIQSGLPLLTSDAAIDERLALSESVVLKKIKSVICVPLRAEDRLQGLLYFHSSKVDHALGTEDLELVTSAALQLSVAVAAHLAEDRLRKALMSTIRALVTAMEVGARGHAQRVSDLAGAVAMQMGLDPVEVHRIRLAGLVHDVGKLAVVQEKPGASPEEIRERHVAAGERILTGIEGFEQILPGVRYHHERADGSGFPYKVRNAETPVLARVIIVANAFDGLCGTGKDPKDALKELAPQGGTRFDDDVVRALVVAHRNGTLFGGGAP